MDVQYGGELPDRIPSEWRRELEPALSDPERRKLRDAYAALTQGDTIRIAYAPGRGATLSVSGADVLSTDGHELIAAFLEIWLGRTPVSEEVKEKLLEGW